MCSLALAVVAWPEKVDMAALAAAPGKPAAWPMRADWIDMAFPMTGQRRASTCNLDMVPPHGEATVGVVVDMARSPAAVAFIMKGHMALDWRKTESMMAVRTGSVRLDPMVCPGRQLALSAARKEESRFRDFRLAMREGKDVEFAMVVVFLSEHKGRGRKEPRTARGEKRTGTQRDDECYKTMAIFC